MSEPTLDEGKIKWIVIANRSEAKIYMADWKLSGLSLVRDIPHPRGRLQNHEINTDDHGSRLGTGGGLQQKHGLDRQEEAIEREANSFAREIARLIRVGRAQGEFEELFLLAEPQFLGRIRTFLDKPSLDRLSLTDNHNWTHLREHEILPKLRSIVREQAA